MKTFIGKVVSTSAPKTVKVAIEHTMAHPLYKKRLRRTTKLLVHNEDLQLLTGDVVKIGQVRPISQRKHFKVLEKIK